MFNVWVCPIICCVVLFPVDMCVFHHPQLTKDMLDSHEREPYPPMILLKVERDQFRSSNSNCVPVEIVGITEKGKKFILKPKQRQRSPPVLSHLYSEPTYYFLFVVCIS